MKKFWKLFKNTAVLLAAAGILCFCALVFKGYIEYKNALQAKPLDICMEEIFQKEDFVSSRNIPDIYKEALIAVEDHRFYRHPGVDVLAMGRALVHDMQAGKLVEGGSTITQQLSKNLYFTQEKTITRKISEVFMALKIESEYTKDEILDLYINSIYYGDGYYSLKEASEGYFNKEPTEMNNYECTLLVGVPNAPSVYAPTASMEMAGERQQQVLDTMVKRGIIEEKDKEVILVQGDHSKGWSFFPISVKKVTKNVCKVKVKVDIFLNERLEKIVFFT